MDEDEDEAEVGMGQGYGIRYTMVHLYSCCMDMA